jgi:hypothetical protein
MLFEGDEVPDLVTSPLELPAGTDWLTSADRFIALWHRYS